jgi:hypothetical protein
MPSYDREDYKVDHPDDEYITRCVVDVPRRTINLFSSEGDERSLTCDTIDEFMRIFDVCRQVMPDEVVYADPSITEK